MYIKPRYLQINACAHAHIYKYDYTWYTVGNFYANGIFAVIPTKLILYIDILFNETIQK